MTTIDKGRNKKSSPNASLGRCDASAKLRGAKGDEFSEDYSKGKESYGTKKVVNIQKNTPSVNYGAKLNQLQGDIAKHRAATINKLPDRKVTDTKTLPKPVVKKSPPENVKKNSITEDHTEAKKKSQNVITSNTNKIPVKTFNKERGSPKVPPSMRCQTVDPEPVIIKVAKATAKTSEVSNQLNQKTDSINKTAGVQNIPKKKTPIKQNAIKKPVELGKGDKTVPKVKENAIIKRNVPGPMRRAAAPIFNTGGPKVEEKHLKSFEEPTVIDEASDTSSEDSIKDISLSLTDSDIDLDSTKVDVLQIAHEAIQRYKETLGPAEMSSLSMIGDSKTREATRSKLLQQLFDECLDEIVDEIQKCGECVDKSMFQNCVNDMINDIEAVCKELDEFDNEPEQEVVREVEEILQKLNLPTDLEPKKEDYEECFNTYLQRLQKEAES